MFSPVQTCLDRFSRCLVAISHPRYIRPADRWYFHRRSLEGLHSSHVIVRRRRSPLGSAREAARATGCRSRPWVDNVLFFYLGVSKAITYFWRGTNAVQEYPGRRVLETKGTNHHRRGPHPKHHAINPLFTRLLIHNGMRYAHYSTQSLN